MSWFTDMAAAAPAGAISAATGGAGSLAALGGGQAGPNGPGGAMAWMQDPSAQPALGHALMGGTQILNGPQPVPGMPPKRFDPNAPMQQAGTPGLDAPWPTTGPFDPSQINWNGPDSGPGGMTGGLIPPWMQGGGGKDSTGMPLITDNWNPGNRGSGQPINQPMSGLPFQSMATGSLQSLGGGQLNQSGMVTLRAPDGSQTKAVPADQVAHWLSRGAVRV